MATCFEALPCFAGLTGGGSRPALRDAPNGDIPGVNADDLVQQGLQEIFRGYQKVAQLDLPPGAAHCFASIHRSIKELEDLVRDAKVATPRPWRQPLGEEVEDWGGLYPEGGFLLRRQTCTASPGDQEYCLGCLYISDLGIAFDSGDSAGEGGGIQTGFIPWDSMTRVATKATPRLGKANTEILLTLEKEKFAQLSIQLQEPTDAEWIVQFWVFRQAAASKSSRNEAWIKKSNSTADAPVAEEGTCQVPASRVTHLAERHEPKSLMRSQSILAQRLTEKVGVAEASAAEAKTVQFAGVPEMDVAKPAKPAKMLKKSSMSKFFTGTVHAEVPKCEAMGTEIVEGVTLDAVLHALEKKDVLPMVYSAVGAFNLEDTPWAESVRVPGTLTRRIVFRLKIVNDAPKAISRLVSIPEDTANTAILRMRPGSEKIVLTTQTTAHDVPYGENFRLQETVSCEPHKGGVKMTKWAELIWVTPLPWTISALKSFIESKAKAESLSGLAPLARVIKESVQ